MKPFHCATKHETPIHGCYSLFDENYKCKNKLLFLPAATEYFCCFCPLRMYASYVLCWPLETPGQRIQTWSKQIQTKSLMEILTERRKELHFYPSCWTTQLYYHSEHALLPLPSNRLKDSQPYGQCSRCVVYPKYFLPNNIAVADINYYWLLTTKRWTSPDR